ncbi:MAG: FxLD family lanthipeptide [Pseudonocardiaceae bacterium]
MVPAMTLNAPKVEDSAVDDAEFAFDMRVVEATTPLVIKMCDTSDGCGSTCSTSACSTGSYDPA